MNLMIELTVKTGRPEIMRPWMLGSSSISVKVVRKIADGIPSMESSTLNIFAMVYGTMGAVINNEAN